MQVLCDQSCVPYSESLILMRREVTSSLPPPVWRRLVCVFFQCCSLNKMQAIEPVCVLITCCLAELEPHKVRWTPISSFTLRNSVIPLHQCIAAADGTTSHLILICSTPGRSAHHLDAASAQHREKPAQRSPCRSGSASVTKKELFLEQTSLPFLELGNGQPDFREICRRGSFIPVRSLLQIFY